MEVAKCIKVVLALSLALLTGEAMADVAPLQGVWRGTIGAKSIVACFNGSTWSSYGSYYYLDHLTPIALNATADGAYWQERDDTGKWALAAPSNGVMVGTWRNGHGKSLPIELTRVDGEQDESACARDSFNAALEAAPKIEVGKRVEFSPGRSYRPLRFAGQETIELFGPEPALRKINSQLKLDQSKEAVDAYFQQRRESLGRVGYPAVDERLTAPDYWDANFITVNFYEWIAGTGRSGISNRYVTWDARTGEQVNLWHWIDVSSKADTPALPPRLKRFLYKGIKEDPECAQGYRGQGDFTLRLGKDGLRIEEEAWGDGCDKAFFIPYKELGPFLSPAGKQAIHAIMSRR